MRRILVSFCLRYPALSWHHRKNPKRNYPEDQVSHAHVPCSFWAGTIQRVYFEVPAQERRLFLSPLVQMDTIALVLIQKYLMALNSVLSTLIANYFFEKYFVEYITPYTIFQ